YKKLVGKNVILPLVGRKIPIVADEYSDPEKGSGAVKITPAHDFNDFEVGKRHNLAQISILSEDARIAVDANEAFLAGAHGPDMPAMLNLHGKDRFVARKAIVEMLEAKGLLEKIEPNIHTVPYGDRSGVVLEPRLTDQWYVDAKKLAVDALKAVKNGRTVFVPKNWEKTYFDWLENIQPWCVSRQLWWGHQIPAWYAEDGEIFVAHSEDEAKAAAKRHFGKDVALKRDEDVLDTWFSSALWPFSTLGWPDKTPELKRYYPTQVLVTGFDIIFFWVARMMMMGLHFIKEVPFHTVYIHALVRDERGAKMSKSKGNVIDPLHLIDDYGADALRFTLAAMAAQGRDIKLSTQRVEGYRNFATKLGNAARFAEMNGARRVAFDPKSAKETLNKWILGEAASTAKEVTSAIEAYKFNDAANAVYRFVWSVFCDWYVELTKPVLTGPDGAAKDETRATAAFVLDEILKLLHPFMPFLTEELWGLTGQVGPKRENLLALSAWPKLEGLENEKAEAEIGWLVELISAVRSVRSEMNVPAAQQVPLVLVASKETRERADRWSDALKRLA
ncbi:MAG TPA: valine--tRNA ligase, partial [Xanthobacteraceae bacterium]|nr:valine--tRNA ligase [Xanthobacteraceae bacterium]